jgi:hypothetical protein
LEAMGEMEEFKQDMASHHVDAAGLVADEFVAGVFNIVTVMSVMAPQLADLVGGCAVVMHVMQAGEEFDGLTVTEDSVMLLAARAEGGGYIFRPVPGAVWREAVVASSQTLEDMEATVKRAERAADRLKAKGIAPPSPATSKQTGLEGALEAWRVHYTTEAMRSGTLFASKADGGYGVPRELFYTSGYFTYSGGTQPDTTNRRWWTRQQRSATRRWPW